VLEIAQSIKSLYTVNLLEGEGVGTAYEYYVKLRKLKKFIDSIERPKTILIAGLPEKYGLSMDFILLGQMFQAETVVIDERPQVLKRAQKVFQILLSNNSFCHRNVLFLKADQIAEFNDKNLKERKIDLALSSEVYQRLDGAQKTYFSNLWKLSKNFAIFAPNRANSSHAELSGLKSVYLDDLLKYCLEVHPQTSLYDYGYLDLPPFPPGLCRSQEKREQASGSRLEAFLMKGLELYSLCEKIIPDIFKAKVAHIAYVIVKKN
jgi:hypothetical protein